jgi:hypothetical protein
MRSYRNPFRYRTSEQEAQQGSRRFVKTFGVGFLDILPEQVWDRLVVIQSAPGAGKTSLLRIFSADTLNDIIARPEEFKALHERMSALGAISDGQVRILGIRLALKKDYQAINDLRLERDRSIKVFFRLLDAQLVREITKALTELYPDARPEDLRIEPASDSADALAQIGGSTVADLQAWARNTHRELLAQLDSVMPPNIEHLGGHHASYAVKALSGASFFNGDQPLSLTPLVMFDDAQDLDSEQRRALIDALVDRDLRLGRWVAERYQALSPDELIADEQPSRGYLLLRIETAARRLTDGPGRRRGKTKGFGRLLLEISDLRASNALYTEAEDDRRLRGLLDVEIEPDDPRLGAAIDQLDERLEQLTAGNVRYEHWLAASREQHDYQGAIDRRATEVLITRDLQRAQGDLFAVPLTVEELNARGGGRLTEASAVLLRHELQLPFYFGADKLAKLASENIEQHITISGELFEEILARVTLAQGLTIEPELQEMIVREASETLWRDIPRRLAHGREIQQLLLNIAAICRADTFRATVPYPPGPTATAITMRDREKLLDPTWRAQTAGAEELFTALAGAVAHNLLGPELDYNVKEDLWMVLNINRLLCPRFGLALGLGGIRERPVETLCAWMVGERPPEEALLEQPLQERLAI